MIYSYIIYLTSYFCFMYLYWSSNFSACSWRIQSHSSWAFSLYQYRQEKVNVKVSHRVQMVNNTCCLGFYLAIICQGEYLKCTGKDISPLSCSPLTWVCPLSGDQCLTPCVGHLGSSSSFPSPFVFLSRSVSAGQVEVTCGAVLYRMLLSPISLWVYQSILSINKSPPCIRWNSSWTESASSSRHRLPSSWPLPLLSSLSLPGWKKNKNKTE